MDNILNSQDDFFTAPNTFNELSRSDFPDTRISQISDFIEDDISELAECTNPNCVELKSRHIEVVSRLQEIIRLEPIVANQGMSHPLGSLDVQAFHGMISTGLIQNTNSEERDNTNALVQFIGFCGAFLKYIGILGDLVASGKKTLVYFRIFIALKYYIRVARIPTPLKPMKGVVALKGDKRSIVYKTNSNLRREAIKYKTKLTEHYARSIRNHLPWRAQGVHFLGSLVAAAGLFIILISYIIQYFDPSISIALYGYCVVVVASLFFFINATCNTLHNKYLRFYSEKYAQQIDSKMYDLEKKNQDQLVMSSNIDSIFLPRDSLELSDSKEINQFWDNAQQVNLEIDQIALKRIKYDLNYALNHLLANFIQEQYLRPDQLSNLDYFIRFNNIEGPIFMFLTGTLGIQEHILVQVVRAYNDTQAGGLEILKGLIFKTKIQRH